MRKAGGMDVYGVMAGTVSWIQLWSEVVGKEAGSTDIYEVTSGTHLHNLRQTIAKHLVFS